MGDKMPEVLLIDPPFPERPWDINWITQFPPKGLLYLAAALREAGIEPEVMDTKIMQYEKPSLLRRSVDEVCYVVRKRVQKIRPKIIGLTSTTLSHSTALKIAKAAKEGNPESLLVFGGVHASFTVEETLRNDFVDVVVRGEGEKTLLELSRGLPLEKIRGVSFRKNGKEINNPDREPLDSSEIPIPAYDLVDMRNYAYVVLVCLRGCINQCSYCEVPFLHGCKIRHRTPEKIGEELNLAFSLNPKLEIRLEDEFFGLDMGRAEKILNMIKKTDPLPFRTVTRPDYINSKLLQLLKSAGCSNLYVGMESGSDDVLRFNNRGLTVQKILDIAKKFERNEMLFHSGFILGLPGETRETLNQTLAVAKKCCDSTFSIVKKNFDMLLTQMPFKLIVENSRAEFNLLAPNPGTPIFRNPKKFRYRIFHRNWDLYDCNTAAGEPYDVKAEEIVKFKTFALNEMKKQMASYGLPVDWWKLGYKG